MIYYSFQPSRFRSVLDLKREPLMRLTTGSSLCVLPKRWLSRPRSAFWVCCCVDVRELVQKGSPTPHLSRHLQKYGKLQGGVAEVSCQLQAPWQLPGGFCRAHILCVTYIYTCLWGWKVFKISRVCISLQKNNIYIFEGLWGWFGKSYLFNGRITIWLC